MMPGISLISDFYTVYISEHISNELAITPMLFPHFVNVLLGWVQSSERRLSLSPPIPLVPEFETLAKITLGTKIKHTMPIVSLLPEIFANLCAILNYYYFGIF